MVASIVSKNTKI